MILEMAALSRLTGESVFEVQIMFINYAYCFCCDGRKITESVMNEQAMRRSCSARVYYGMLLDMYKLYLLLESNVTAPLVIQYLVISPG
jgi:hypothetical protein